MAITEQRTRADIDRLAEVLERAIAAERKPAFRRWAHDRRRRRRADDLRALQARPAGVRAAAARRARAPARRAAARRACAARSRPRLPEVSEPEIVRHYNRLSKRNFDLDTGFYPLGSCTMKHNPKLHERVAALPGHAKLHPLQDPSRAQGALELMWRLQDALAEIAGLPHVSLQPSAGSHGELAGVLLTRAFHEDRGEHRTKVLTPDTAHGTNPATVTMAGYEVVKVGTDAHGNVDLDDLRAKADRGRRLPDADQSLDARAVRARDRGDRADRPRRRRDAVLRRRQPQRDHGHLPARATWASTSCTSTCTSRSPSPTAAAARAPARSRSRSGSSRSCRARRWSAARAPATARRGAALRPRLRPAEVDRPPARLPGQLRRVRPLLRLHPLARRRRPARRLRGRRAERQLPAGPAAPGGRRSSTCRRPTSGSACTSSCSPARR